MKDINKRINLCNKIYPYLSGFSSDLLFWAAINTIFLITVKQLSASQVSLLTAISSFAAIFAQNIILKIIKKIGNVKSVRLGLILLFIAAIIITSGNSFTIIVIGEVLYHISLLFKGMDCVILKRNLKYLKQEDSFIEIQSKSSIIYAVSTMVISFIAGFIFNINNYLPMILCCTICFINIIASSFLYEPELQEESTQVNNNNKSFKWTEVIFLIILLYGLLYSTLETAQENGKIFIQYTLQNFMDVNKTAIYLSIIISLSRISRVLSNMFFSKIYRKLKNKFIIVLNISLIASIAFLIIGSLFSSNIIGIIIMSLGFCLLLWARDPIQNVLKNELLNNCNKETQQTAILKFNLSSKIARCIWATLVSLILLKVDMFYIMVILLIFAVVYLGGVIKLYKLLNYNRGKSL